MDLNPPMSFHKSEHTRPLTSDTAQFLNVSNYDPTKHGTSAPSAFTEACKGLS